tara:strand:- start:369 stop:833 length:465 start_codon:yes stop_codon:yes gene_type:complete
MSDYSGNERRGRSRGTKIITIIGNLGADPEMRSTSTGVPVTSFNVAVTDVRRGRDGQEEENTDWFRVSCWRGLAEIANNYLQRGSQVFVSGRFRTSTWTGNDGQTRTSLEVQADQLQLLARSRDDGGSGSTPSPQSSSGTQQSPGEIDPDDLPF